MKVLIPLIRKEGELEVPEALEDASEYVIYEASSNKFTEFNMDRANREYKAPSFFDVISKQGINGLVTGFIRPAAYNRFLEMGINLYKPTSLKLSDIVDAIRSDSLIYADRPVVKEMTGCMGSCNDCVSVCQTS